MSIRLLPALVLIVLVAPALAEYQLEIGPDTTVIDGPLNPDGTINYLAYLNEKLSEGVTPENNFAVDVAMVMPPAPHGWPSEAFQDKVFMGLGVEKPVSGPYIVTIKDAIALGEEIAYEDPRYQSWLDVISNPWTAEEHPEVHQWLDSQDAILDHIQKKASRKSRYYFPWVVKAGSPEALDSVLLPCLGTLRVASRGFQARAEWHIASGDLEAALSDVRTIRLVANHIMQEPLSMSWVVGVSFHRMATTVIEDVAGSELLTSELAKRMIGETELYRRVRPYGEEYLSSDRFATLDLVMHHWKGRGGLFPEPLIHQIFHPLMKATQYDPNVTLRAVNDWNIRWVEVCLTDDYREQLEAIDHLQRISMIKRDRALKLLDGDSDAARLMRKEVLASNRQTAALTEVILDYTFGNKGTFYKTQARINMRFDLAPVALAIGGYHAEYGEYPSDLQALVPAYLDNLPIDFATGELPMYRIEDGAAPVYSLGTDLEDDGGLDNLIDGDIVFRIER